MYNDGALVLSVARASVCLRRLSQGLGFRGSGG